MLLLLALFILSGCMMTPPDTTAGLDQEFGGAFLPVTTPTPTATPQPTDPPVQATQQPGTQPTNPLTGTNEDVFNQGGQSGQVVPTKAPSLPTAPPALPTAQTLPTATPPKTVATATIGASATATPGASALKDGSTGQAVKTLQQRLKDLGYYTGSVDGSFGKGTTQAVKEFQQANGLNADGVAGANTLNKVNSSSAKKKATPTPKVTTKPTPKVTATPRPTATPNLSKETYFRLGDSGKNVSQLQDRLISLGYMSGKSTGKFDALTEEAIKAFQERAKKAKLYVEYVDGVAGPDTQRALYDSRAPKANNLVGSMGETLREGMKGNSVRSMQKKLAEYGYLTSGQADGVYGGTTKSAVTYFQQRNNLTPVDGVAGSKTLEKLYSGSAVRSDGTGGSNNTDDTPSSDGYVTLRPGASGDAVKKLQQGLKNSGYTVSADGKYGGDTTSAVTTFQLLNGLKVDGIAGAATQRLLFGDTPNDPKKYSPIRHYDEGSAVRTMQSTLKELGYYQGSVNGIHNELSINAVKEFQQNNGLKADGTAGSDTLGVMYSSLARPAGMTTTTYVVLSEGDRGEVVGDLQSRLKDLKYLSSNYVVSQYYDGSTKAAVMAFQTKNGLKVDGKAGEDTQRLIFLGNPIAN